METRERGLLQNGLRGRCFSFRARRAKPQERDFLAALSADPGLAGTASGDGKCFRMRRAEMAMPFFRMMHGGKNSRIPRQGAAAFLEPSYWTRDKNQFIFSFNGNTFP
jgi:hypothetical protein